MTDYSGHGIYLLFRSSPSTGGPSCRVMGPYKSVRFGAKGIWGYGEPGEEPLRIATQALESLCWEIDGLDDPLWGEVLVIAPDRTVTASEIEAGNDWIRPR